MATLAEAIEANQRRQARYRKAERLLRAIRMKVFEYEDEGKFEKAQRIITKLKKRLTPLWEVRSHDVSEAKLQNYFM